MDKDAPQTLEARLSPAALEAADLRIGGYVSIAMFAAGATLLPAVALPFRETVQPEAVVAIGAVSLACAIAFAVLTRSGRISRDNLYSGDYVWIAVTAALVAASGGRSSPFFLLYPLPVLHAAAFQSMRRMEAVTLVAVLAFLTPLLYDSGQTALFVAGAVIAVPPTVVVAWSLNTALATLRRQRRDLTAAEHEAWLQARSDPLTGLGNFRLLWSALEAETSRARRYGEQFSLIVLDLDRFKTINDELGHGAGDAALRDVAAALRSGLRDEDVCCRHGGDEFSVIAVGAGDAEARELANRLVDSVGEVRAGPDGQRALGATAGWATFYYPARTAEDLMRAADAMLLERKYGQQRPRAAASASALATSGRLELLESLGRSIARARDEHAVIEATIAHLAGAVEAVAVTAVRREEADLRVVAEAGSTADSPADRPIRSLAAEALVARVAMARAVTGPDARGIRSRLALPLIVGGDAWGALVLESNREGGFDDAERQVAVEMSIQAARGLAHVLVLAQLPDAGPEEVRRLVDAFQERSAERRRIAELSRRLGRVLGMGADELEMLSVAAFLRDLGNAVVPAAVLDKPAHLTATERVLLSGQPIAGEQLVRGMPRLRGAARVIRQAHERWDGSGYPDGVEGEAISQASRVLHACAAWVALTSPRPWRPALDSTSAREELRRMAGRQLDPGLVDQLLRLGPD